MVIIPVVSVNCDPEFLHFHVSQATAALEEKAKLEKSLKDLQQLQGDQEVNTVQTPHPSPPTPCNAAVPCTAVELLCVVGFFPGV